MVPSLPTTLILIVRRRWKSCTTLDHTRAIWRLKSVIQISSVNSETDSILVFVTISKRVRFEANGFYYHIRDFVFLAPTGDIEDGLTVAEYDQGTTRYTGTEARLDAAVHPAVWLNLGLDYVNAKLTQPALRCREFRRCVVVRDSNSGSKTWC